MSIQFTKMQGLGNDFVVIDITQQPFILSPEWIRNIADRHYGVGCDQVLIVRRSDDPHADFDYRIFNADGSEVSQCGNGARCVGLFVRYQKLTQKKKIVFKTNVNYLTVTTHDDEHFEVEIDAPLFEAKDIPFISTEQLPENIALAGVVNVGNPHAVIRVNEINLIDVARIGAALNHHPAFPERVNVGFMRLLSQNEIDLCVYERGVGITKACGSGACAAVAVGRQQGWLNAQVKVCQAGGDLIVRYPSLSESVFLQGPAVVVFDGYLSQRLSSFASITSVRASDDR